jgi:DASS family divalent anion:Na+ symporter
MAPNPIVLAKANQLFPDLRFGFSTWITGSIVPALVCAIVLPLFLAWSCNLHKSTVSDSEQGEGVKSDMVEYAKKELNYMGSMSSKEKVKYNKCYESVS